MKIRVLLFLVALNLLCSAQPLPIAINVDVARDKGELKPIWAWFGHDEPNYTYMKDGKKLLSELAELSPVPVYMRTHNLMTSGDGVAALKWGSTNIYTEDKDGNPVYDWTITDRIFDTYMERKMKPLVEIGFMPEALTSGPEPYRHHWNPSVRNSPLFTGWAYPPKDYNKWAELIYQWVKHCVERYGKAEVESWYWELWNEPNIGYLQSKEQLKDFCKMYDYASDAVKRALPTIRMGGPHSTGDAHEFLRSFIQHCLTGKNEATGKTGAPLDFVAFHAKGSPTVVDGVVRMGIMNQLQNVRDNLEVIASFPETKNLPVIIGESDPEGCAACGMNTHPSNGYRNGTMYSSYTAASVARIYDINESLGTNLIGAVNWSFEFEGQPWFLGYRDLATNGVDKPVLNVFRMMGKMKGNRVEVSGDFSYDSETMCQSGVRGEKTDINALASAGKKSIAVLVWNYHDVDKQDEGNEVVVNLKNVKGSKATLKHYRIDAAHSNSYEVWKKMGSPQNPTAEQYSILEKSGQLEMLSEPEKIAIKNKEVSIPFKLPRQAVSLLLIEMK